MEQLPPIQAYLGPKNNSAIGFLQTFYKVWPQMCLASPFLRDQWLAATEERGASIKAGAARALSTNRFL
jgi:hypothetical protein